MNIKHITRVVKKEFIWLFPRIVFLTFVSAILSFLLHLGYLSSELYSLSSRVWFIAYFIFGAAIFRRYLIGSIRELFFKFGSRYIQDPKDRIGLRRSTYLYSRIIVYAVYLLAILASINLFLNLHVIWQAIGTTFTLIITFFIGLMTSSVLGNLIAYEAIRQSEVVSVNDVIETSENVYGNVIGRGAFFTKVKTTKNEIVTIPNLELVNKSVKNYSKENPVIVHIPISLGYDVKKNAAKKLLLEAARKTVGVLQDPSSFILFLELGNYSITYEINAYIDKPHDLVDIKSRLMENIIDTFEKNKIEILSPQYAVLKIADMKKMALEAS